jgi:peptide-methionine (S)-S-oxide reductase
MKIRFRLSTSSWICVLFLGVAGCIQPVSSSPQVRVAEAQQQPQDQPTPKTDSVKADSPKDTVMPEQPNKDTQAADQKSDAKPKVTETATFGAGCFWCVEAVFDQLKGVDSVTSGYMGGQLPNPTYEQICTGLTGHAEVIQVKFDPKVISYDKLLDVFWKTHDPTTLNQQGADQGTQYRSAVFYHNDKQLAQAKAKMKKLNDAKEFRDPIVTLMEKLSVFYKAENYHQDYFKLNGRDPYCRAVIPPKLNKLQQSFGDLIKKK